MGFPPVSPAHSDKNIAFPAIIKLNDLKIKYLGMLLRALAI